MSASPTRTVTVSANDPGAAVSKFLITQFMARGNSHEAARIASERCRSTPIVEHTFRQMIQKGAVTATALGSSDPYGLGGEAFALLQSKSIFGRLLPRCRRLPFRVKVPKDTSGGTGAWRAEGTAGPVTKHVTETLTQDVFISDYIVTITQELLRFGAVTEATVRQMVIDGLARWIDTQLLDRTITASASRPASLTAGTVSISSAGTSAANISTDLLALIAGTTTPLDNAVYVMRPRTYDIICEKSRAAGSPVERGYLGNIPVITGSTSPQQIALIDLDNIAVSYDDAVGLDLSTETVLQMDSAPTSSGITGTGSAAVSLWQAGLAAVKAEMHVSWQHVHFNSGSPTVPAGVATVAVTY